MKQEPGTSLARQGKRELDLKAPDRAETLVHEFVASVVEEAEDRANQIVEEAKQDAVEQLESARAAALRVRERIATVAAALTEAVALVKDESQELGGHSMIRDARREPSSEGEIYDARVVEEETSVPEEMSAQEEAPALPSGEGGGHSAPGPSTAAALELHRVHSVAEEQQDTAERVGTMTDEELAFAYAEALDASDRHLGDALVEEALQRAQYADPDADPPKAMRKRFGRGGKAREAYAKLREACLLVKEQRVGEQTPAG